MILNGLNWGEEVDWLGEGIPQAFLHIPLGRVNRGGLFPGAQAAGDRTSHEVFSVKALLRASADRVLFESGSKTAGIRPCLATQKVSVLKKKKKAALSCPLLLSLFHSPRSFFV